MSLVFSPLFDTAAEDRLIGPRGYLNAIRRFEKRYGGKHLRIMYHILEAHDSPALAGLLYKYRDGVEGIEGQLYFIIAAFQTAFAAGDQAFKAAHAAAGLEYMHVNSVLAQNAEEVYHHDAMKVRERLRELAEAATMLEPTIRVGQEDPLLVNYRE
jgi:hypothetical protein